MALAKEGEGERELARSIRERTAKALRAGRSCIGEGVHGVVCAKKVY